MLPSEATGWNMTATFSTGLPSKVIRPETGATWYGSLLQPANSMTRTARISERHRICSSSEQEGISVIRARRGGGLRRPSQRRRADPPEADRFMPSLDVRGHFPPGDRAEGREYSVHVDA